MVTIFHKVVYINWEIFFLFWAVYALWNSSHAERRESLFFCLL